MGRGGCKFIDEVVIGSVVGVIEEAASKVLASDADRALGLEEELACIGLVGHWLLLVSNE